MIEKLFNYVMNNGEVSNKKDVLTALSSKSENVYTKKVDVTDKKIRIGDSFVNFISLTSYNGKFDDVNKNDIRLNFKNVYNKWVNVPAQTLPSDTLKNILNSLSIH